MKNLKYALLLSLSAAAVVSCQENADMVGIEAPVQGEAIILTATAPSTPSTRIIESVTTSGVTLNWFGGDQWNQPDRLSVYNADTGAKVGNYIINERNGAQETATFSPIGDDVVSGAATYEVVYSDAEFTLEAGVNYVAVFPASDSSTLSARNSESIVGDQYQNQTGGWRYAARLISNEFTTANPSLTFSHQTALMAIDFIVPSGAVPTKFSCTAGDVVAALNVNSFTTALSKYTASFVMYPTSEDKLTFAITDANGDVTTVVRNIAADIEAGYYYSQSLVEEAFIFGSAGDLVADGSMDSGNLAGNVTFNMWLANDSSIAWSETGGVDDSGCVVCSPLEGTGNPQITLYINKSAMTLVAGDTYRYEFDLKSTVPFSFDNSSVQFREQTNYAWANTLCASISSTVVSEEWGHYIADMTIPDDVEQYDSKDDANYALLFSISGAAGGEVTIDNISFGEGELQQAMLSDE